MSLVVFRRGDEGACEQAVEPRVGGIVLGGEGVRESGNDIVDLAGGCLDTPVCIYLDIIWLPR